MKVHEQVSKTYEAFDGTTFESKELCEKHEKAEILKKIGKSKYYVLTTPWGGFRKFRFGRAKGNAHIRYVDGTTSNVKYATKFYDLDDTYKYGGQGMLRGYGKIITCEEATKISEENVAAQKKAKIREQRYVCEYDRTPAEDGEYITNLGMVWYQNGAGWEKIPEFWMKKVNKTYR
jgi:hypothetical protein